MLTKIIDKLKNDKIILEETKNQLDKKINTRTLYINKEGQFEISELYCYNSSHYGLGTCKCLDHPARGTYVISALKGLELIKNYILKKTLKKN